MFGHESKTRLKKLLIFVATQEIDIEKLRQITCAMRDFEPYTAFRRIDRNCSGLIDANDLT
jgi:hypothetical protein